MKGRKAAKGRSPGLEAREGQRAAKNSEPANQGASQGQEGGRPRGQEAREGREAREARVTVIEPCITLRIRRALLGGKKKQATERTHRCRNTRAIPTRLDEAWSRSRRFLPSSRLHLFLLPQGPSEALRRAQLNPVAAGGVHSFKTRRWVRRVLSHHLGPRNLDPGCRGATESPCPLRGRLLLVMDTWPGRRKTRAWERTLFVDPVHVGGDTNKTLDKVEGLFRTVFMHAREAVERRAYPGQRKSLSDSTQTKTQRGPKKTAPF